MNKKDDILLYEQDILGYILNNSTGFTDVNTIIDVDSFTDIRHKNIYSVFVELNKKSQNINIITVCNYLREKELINSIGGESYIVSLTTNYVSTSVAIDIATILMKEQLKRNLKGVCYKLLNYINNSIEIEEILNEAEKQLVVAGNRMCNNKRNIVNIQELAVTAIDEIQKQVVAVRNNQPIGITTGIKKINQKLNGGFKTGLYILAARPSIGKTAVALHFAKSASDSMKAVLFFSLEMSAVDLTKRIIQGDCNDDIKSINFRNGYLNDEEISQIVQIASNITPNIYIDTQNIVNIAHIKSVSRQFKSHNICDLIIIDYLQLISIGQDRGMNREQAIAQATRELKLLSGELDVPILLLCQLNRAAEARLDKRPQLADLRESGAIEQDADVVMLLYRPEFYGIKITDDGLSTKGLGELIVAKNRNGTTGEVLFNYNESLTKISDYKFK